MPKTKDWIHTGHTLGECYHDKDKKITYVHIPKNASSFIKGCVLGSLKFERSLEFIQGDRYLVLLREPVERWVSGIATYEFFYNHTNLPFEQITLDDHTEKQSWFLQYVDLDKCDFFMVNNQLATNVKCWFDSHGYTVDVTNRTYFNKSRGTKREELKSKYQTYINNNLDFMLKLKKHFEEDYELINQVKFYGT